MQKLSYPVFILIILLINLTAFKIEPSTQSDGSTNQDKSTLAAKFHADGLKLFNEKKFSEAIAVWHRELEFDPTNVNTLNNIGMAHKNLGDHTTAIQYHNKAIQLNPNFGHGYYSLGLAYYALKDYEQAKSAFLKAIQLNYDPVNSYFNLGLSYERLSEFDLAKAAFEKTKKLNSSYPMLFDHLRFVNNKILGTAHPTDANSFFNIGMAFKDNQNQKEAEKAFLEALKLDPLHPVAHYQLGWLYLSRDDKILAEQEFRKNLKINPKDEETISAVKNINGIKEQTIDPNTLNAFNTASFPQEGVVVIDKAILYDFDLFTEKQILPTGTTVTITGIHNKIHVDHKNGKNYFFYKVNNPTGLIDVRNVILAINLHNPAYTSPKKKFNLIKAPVDFNSSHLWLKSNKGKLVFLGELNGYGNIVAYNKNRDTIVGYCQIHGSLSWSPDEQYLFIPFSGNLFMRDGSFVTFSQKAFTSPVWQNGKLYLRGAGRDDAVYTLNLKTMEFKKFLDIDDGEKIEIQQDCLVTHNPVEIKSGKITAFFSRRNLDYEYYKTVTAKQDFVGVSPPGCLIVTVVSTMEGKIISKQKELTFCEDNI